MHKRRRSHIPRARAQIWPRIDSVAELLTDLLPEMRGEIRTWLDPEDRVLLQWTCKRMYNDDPGFIVPVYLLESQIHMEQIMGPVSVFDVARIAFHNKWRDGTQYRHVERVLTAHTTHGDCIHLMDLNTIYMGLDNIYAVRAIVGLDLPSTYATDGRYMHKGQVDRDLIRDEMQSREFYDKLESGWYDHNSSEDSVDSDEEMRAIEIEAHVIDAKEQRLLAKYKDRRVLMVYAALRQAQRRAWKEKQTNVMPV